MATATKPARATATRFTISREKLIEGLSAVAPCIPGTTTLPVLGNLLLETTDYGLRISGTDLDRFVSIEIAADVEKGGAITVPAKRLLAIAKELSPAPVRISWTDSHVLVDCGRASYRIHTLPTEDFPKFPELDFSGESWRLKAGELQQLAKRAAFAASTESSRPIINGVLIQLESKQIRAVATTGHLLAHVETRVEEEVEFPADDLIVPPKFFEHINRLFGADEDIEIAHTQNHLAVRSDFRLVCTRLIEGPYPNYNQVVPKKHARVAKLDRHSLISAIRRMVPVASDQVKRLKLVFATGKLELHAMTPDVGEGHDEIGCDLLEGEGVTIGANASYLLDVLARIDGDEVLIRSGDPSRAMIIRSAAESEDLSAFYLVMPLRLHEE